MSPTRTAIPLVDLRASFEPIREEVLEEFGRLLDRMDLFLGANVQAFEREFADFCEAAHGVGVSSGTAALASALRAWGVGPGDEVIAPSHTFFASVEAILHVGAQPVLVDVEPETLTIDPEQVRRALSPASKAVMPVHLYGQPADMDPIAEIAAEFGLRIVEDAAQAHGARYRGRRCGSLGDAGCFSFYFTKNLGAYGEGGFVTTRDPEVAERVRLLRNHGRVSKFEHGILGDNLRLDELQAAVLRIRLRKLDEGLERRREIARRYDRRLRDAPLRLLRPRPGCEAAYHLYPVLLEGRDALASHLAECGIGTGIHYPVPAHRQPALRDHRHRCGPLPVTEQVCDELLSLPIYPELTDAQVDLVADRTLEFLEQGGASAGARARIA